MRIIKVTQRVPRSKPISGYDHYIALDWSIKSMAIGHMEPHDQKPRIFERPANLKEFKEYLSSLKGSKIITVEESGTAHWLYLELVDKAERILICEPFHNKLLCHGPKTDKIDAGKLCELLRAGLLREVYHSNNGLYDLRILVSGYEDVVRFGVRAMNQKAALALGHRNEGKTASLVGEVLQEEIELYRRSRDQYKKRLAICRSGPAQQVGTQSEGDPRYRIYRSGEDRGLCGRWTSFSVSGEVLQLLRPGQA